MKHKQSNSHIDILGSPRFSIKDMARIPILKIAMAILGFRNSIFPFMLCIMTPHNKILMKYAG